MSTLRRLVDLAGETARRVVGSQPGHAALLGLAPWTLVRLATGSTYAQVAPGLVTWARVVLGVYALGLLGLTLWAPRLLLVPAAVAGLAGVALAWRARPAYGYRGGLPPGSLALMPRGGLDDLWFYRQAAARHGPVFKTSWVSRPMVGVVGLRRGLALLREHRSALGPNPLPFNRFIPRGFLRAMAPGTHEGYRALFRAALVREVVDSCEPALAVCVRQGLQRLASASAAAGDAGVGPLDHLQDLVFRALARCLLGIPPGSDAVPRLRALYQVIDFRNPTGASDQAVVAALQQIEGTIRDQLAAGDPAQEDAPRRAVLLELQRTAPASLADPTVVGNLIYMLQTGTNDVTGLLHWVLKILSDHPDCVARLRQELDAGGPEAAHPPESLASRVVLECLRLEQSEALQRVATADIRAGGLRIPKGWLVRICIRESHRDPAVFADPDRFDPDRFAGRRYTREEYSPFGLDGHSCLGDHLTRMVARVFVTELVAGHNIVVVGDGPRELGRWHHWTPSRAFRIALVPRD